MTVTKLLTSPPKTEKPKKSITIKTPLNDGLATSLHYLGKLGLIFLAAEIQPQRIRFEFEEGYIELRFQEPQVKWAITISGGFRERERTEPLYLIIDEPVQPITKNRNPTLDFRNTNGVRIEFKSEQPMTTLVLIPHSSEHEDNWLRLSTEKLYIDRTYNQVEGTFWGYPNQITVSVNGKTVIYDITNA